ncbi:MAG: type II and III secretion system protein family protein [Planctomycetaceae bacterium]|nr:type II and III secretion system protein family protein [Planctomycetaceae bacterium]
MRKSGRMDYRPWKLWGLYALLAAVVLAGSAQAIIAAAGDSQVITILHRQSQVVTTPWKVVRVAVTDPLIADVKVLTPDQVLVQGLSVGTTDILMWSSDETQVMQKTVKVVMDTETMGKTLQMMFPTSRLTLEQSGATLLIKGTHRNALHAVQLREYLAKTKIEYVDMTDVAGVQQVQLQIRVAEVSKSGLRQLGVQWLAAGSDFISGIAPGGKLASELKFEPGAITKYEAGPSVTAFGEIVSADLVFFLEALQENQYLRLLATPTLIALNGEEASFLAGGEYPIPVPQGGAGTNATTITIEYKEYGVRLNFRPTVMGDGTIRLHTAPEVSELTNVGSVVINDFVVPALLTRRAETTIELKSGQSFAIAGLLSDSSNAINSSIPGLGSLPILGPLFRSVEYQKKETELVILVTANLVEPMDIDPDKALLPGATHTAPTDWELYLEGKIEGQPAMLNNVDAQWLKELGLDQLNGPGAWDNYGQPAPASTAEL